MVEMEVGARWAAIEKEFGWFGFLADVDVCCLHWLLVCPCLEKSWIWVLLLGILVVSMPVFLFWSEKFSRDYGRFFLCVVPLLIFSAITCYRGDCLALRCDYWS